MTKFAIVHPVYLINVEQRRGSADQPSDEAIDCYCLRQSSPFS